MHTPAARLAICLMGPTATGKTDLALALADRLPLDVISVDSAMVYRHLDIGSGKPSASVLARVPHRLIDIRDPWEQYSAGEFATDAESALRDSAAANRLPLLVGGTFLYFRSLVEGLAPLPPADPAVRAEIEQRATDIGWKALHGELKILDPHAAARIDPNDRQRIQRALEVHRLTGEPLSRLQRRPPGTDKVRFLKIALVPRERQQLHQRIAVRLDAMLDRGFVAEVERLLAMPAMNATRPALRAVGYRQICGFLTGEYDHAVARSRALAATRQLAKRQLTWLRGEKCDSWLDMESGTLPGELEKVIRDTAARMQYKV